MSFRLEAPYPGVVAIMELPNPELSDTQARKLELDVFRSMTGTIRTYVYNNGYKKFSFDFRLSKQRAEALKNLVRLYLSEQIRFTYDGNRYIGYFSGNPVEFSHNKSLVTVQLLLEVKDA